MKQTTSFTRKRLFTVLTVITAIVLLIATGLTLSSCRNKSSKTTDALSSKTPSSPVTSSQVPSGETPTSGFVPDPDKIISTGLPSKKEGTVYYSPSSVAAGKDCLYIADATNYAVYKMSTDGKVLATAYFNAPVQKVYYEGKKVYALAGELAGVMAVFDEDLNTEKVITVGHTPSDMIIDGGKAYVAVRFENKIAVVDLAGGKVLSEIAVTREPVALALAKGKLYVGNHLPAGSSIGETVSSVVDVIDLATAKAVKSIPLVNGAQSVKGMAVSADGSEVYVTHIISRYTYPTTQLDRGWVNTNGFTTIKTTDDSTVAFLLDEVELGAGNPWDVEVYGTKLIFSISGTGELMIVDKSKLDSRVEKVIAGKDNKVKNVSEIVEHIEFLGGLQTRIDLGGEGVRDITVSGDTVYAAQYFTGDIAVVDVKEGTVTVSYPVATQPENSDVRVGEIIWYSAENCYQQWESCASCHPDGRADALNWDNLNDGIGNPKNTKSMVFSHRTPPVMITGARVSAELAVRKGMMFIQFNVLEEDQLCALDEYLKSLMPTDSPYLTGKGEYTEAALRGKQLFEEVGCATCHPAPLYTDLKFHKSPYLGTDGTWENREFITPTLVEIWRSAPYSFCGGVSRDQIIKDFSKRTLSGSELADLKEFVLSIGTVAEKYGVEQVSSSKGDAAYICKLVPGTTIDAITVRKQVATATGVKDAVLTVKLCKKDGTVITEKKLEPGKMTYNQVVKLEPDIAVPADFAVGGYLEITIKDADGKELASVYKLSYNG